MSSRKFISAVLGLSLSLAAGATTAAAQSGTIAGTVTDRGSGQPVSGAQVAIEGTTRGAVTQENGRFTIPNVGPGTYSVTIRRVGYIPATRRGITVTAGATATVDEVLEVSALRLQSMVVTGTTDPVEGVRAPFSVGRVNSEDLKTVPTVNSAAAAIQGKVAGVSIIRSSGQPGAGVQVQLRSPNNIRAGNSPMYVVDGVILGSTFDATTVDLEALDIESVEVVKGAAAASLYGSRAANGVISIKTSRGTSLAENETRISARTEFGRSSTPTNLSLNMHHYFLVDEQGRYINSAGQLVSPSGRIPDPDGISDNAFGRQTYNNIGNLFQPDGFVTLSTNISQNSQASNFLVSLNQKTERGALENNDGFVQRSGRVNLDHRIGDAMSFSISAFHSRANRDLLSGDPFWDILMFQPDIDLLQRDSTGQYNRQPDPLYADFENPLWRQASRENNTKRARTLASVDARWSATSWLSLSSNLSYDRSDLTGEFYLPKGTPISLTSDQESNGQVDKSAEVTDALNASVTATAMWNFGNLTTRFTGGAIAERENNLAFSASGTNLFVRDVPDLSIANTRTVSSGLVDIRSEGYLATAALDYSGKYVLDGLIRRDGSSLFGPLARWNNYYRASGAYLLSEEPWWPAPETMSLFKLRYSIGTAGSRPSFTNRYETWTVNGTTGAVSKGTLGNVNLRPAHTTEQEFGVDFIIRNLYSFELSYIRSSTKNQLADIELSAITGYADQWRNMGRQDGSTYEATFQANFINRKDLSWSATLIADHSDTKIINWETTCFATGLRYVCPGNSLAGMYGARHVRRVEQLPTSLRTAANAFQRNDDGYLVPVGVGGSYQDRLFGTTVDVNGTSLPWGLPILQLNDDGSEWFGKIGSSLADVNLGYLNNVKYKGFNFHTHFQAQVGGDVYNNTRQRLYQHNRHGDVDQTGKPEQLKKPISYYTAVYNRNDNTAAFVEDGSYLKLRELALTYRITPSLLQRVGLGNYAPEGISVGVIGRNIWTLTNYRGYDPEVGSPANRYDSFTYPPTRTLTGTVEITF